MPHKVKMFFYCPLVDFLNVVVHVQIFHDNVLLIVVTLAHFISGYKRLVEVYA